MNNRVAKGNKTLNNNKMQATAPVVGSKLLDPVIGLKSRSAQGVKVCHALSFEFQAKCFH